MTDARKVIRKSSLVLLFVLASVTACKDRSAFDTDVWKADADCPDGSDRRSLMTNDLEQAHLRLGMTKEDVFALLGEPEIREDATFIYCLGRGLIDFDSYYIGFDAENRIKSFRQVQG